jgi:hypothetical protein
MYHVLFRFGGRRFEVKKLALQHLQPGHGPHESARRPLEQSVRRCGPQYRDRESRGGPRVDDL